MKHVGRIAVALLFSTFIAACSEETPGAGDAGYPSYAVSGEITVAAGQDAKLVKVGGVTLTLTGGSLLVPATTTSSADGGYSFPSVKSGKYTLSPSPGTLQFTPPSRAIEVKSEGLSGLDFAASVQTATTYQVSGKITTDGGNTALATGVELTLTDTKSGAIIPATSNDAGVYTFSGVVAGSYTLKPAKKSVVFEPVDQSVTVPIGTVPVKDFVATDGTYTVSGTITSPTNQNVDGVLLTMTGGSPAVTLTATSANGGKYTFSAKVKSGPYQLRPSKAGLEFTPAVLDFSVDGADRAAPNLVAAAAPVGPFACDSTTRAWCRPSVAALTPALRQPIYGIWAASANEVWFVGGRGTILRYSSPETWTQLDAGVTHDFYAIVGTSPSDVWVAGTGGTSDAGYTVAYHYVQGANPAWSRIEATFTSGDINVLWNDTATLRFAGCDWILGVYSTDGGGFARSLYNRSGRFYSAWAANKTVQWVVGRYAYSVFGDTGGARGPRGMSGASGLILQLGSDGSWVDTNSVLNLWTPSLQDAVDAGTSTWSSTGGTAFSDVRGTSDSDVWAVGATGLVAHFDGGIWDVVDAGVGSTNLYGVWPVSANEVWFAGGDPVANTGKLFKLTDAGTKWTAQDITTLPGDAGVLYRVYVDSATKAVWLGGSSGILRYQP